MSQPGYQEGSEPMWWWKVALHLDEAQIALANATAHNLDDPRLPHALYDRLRDGQAILLEIFRAKGLLPGSTNGKIEAPMPEMPVPAAPMPGWPMPVVPVSPPAGSNAVAADPPPIADQPPLLGADEPAVSEADLAAMVAAASEPERPPPEVAVPAAITPEAPPEAPADPGAAGGAGG